MAKRTRGEVVIAPLGLEEVVHILRRADLDEPALAVDVEKETTAVVVIVVLGIVPALGGELPTSARRHPYRGRRALPGPAGNNPRAKSCSTGARPDRHSTQRERWKKSVRVAFTGMPSLRRR